MPQYARPTLNAAVDDGITLSTKFNLALLALYTTHAGPAAPPSPELGQPWIDTSGEGSSPSLHVMKVYDGTTFRTMGTLNRTTGAYSVAGNLALTGGILTGNLYVPVGSAAAPSYSFDGRTSTGIYSSAASEIAFSTGGTQRMVLKNGTLEMSVPTYRITAEHPRVVADRSTGASGSAGFVFRVNNVERWILLSDGNESTGDAGSNLSVRRYSDTGVLLGTSMFVNRASGWIGLNTSSQINSCRVSIQSGNSAILALENTEATSDAAADIRGVVAGGLRGTVAFRRKAATTSGQTLIYGYNGASLVLSATFDSDGQAYFASHVTAAGDVVSTGGNVRNTNATMGSSAGIGIVVSTVITDGATFTAQRPINGTHSGAGFTYEFLQVPGSFYSSRINTNGSLWDFRNDGNAYALGGSWIPSSDSRLKNNQQPLSGMLEKIQQLIGKSYTMGGTPRLGLIAQETLEVQPELVSNVGKVNDIDNLLGVDYNGVVAMLVEAVKELAAKVAALEGR